MPMVPDVRSSRDQLEEAVLGPVLDFIESSGARIRPEDSAWTSTYRSKFARLAGPIDFDLLESHYSPADYVVFDRDHDAIAHLEAREYILGSGYALWESEGKHLADGRILLSPYPSVEGPEYENLDPIARALWKHGRPRGWFKREPRWESTIDGQVLRWPAPLDFEFIRSHFVLPDNIRIGPQNDYVTDRYTWAIIRGSNWRAGRP